MVPGSHIFPRLLTKTKYHQVSLTMVFKNFFGLNILPKRKVCSVYELEFNESGKAFNEIF